MTSYFLFAGDRYYPNGGWEDYRGSFETENAALESAKEHFRKEFTFEGWWSIVDSSKLLVVKSGQYVNKQIVTDPS